MAETARTKIPIDGKARVVEGDRHGNGPPETNPSGTGRTEDDRPESGRIEDDPRASGRIVTDPLETDPIESGHRETGPLVDGRPGIDPSGIEDHEMQRIAVDRADEDRLGTRTLLPGRRIEKS